jgi:hypothetical protein
MIDGGRAANANALLEAVKSATKSTRINTLINTTGIPIRPAPTKRWGRAAASSSRTRRRRRF